jgi:nucleoside-diphosphate-sugar epimerase
MATVLVTGASGFIGGHLVEALVARGDRVRCLVRPTSNLELLRTLDVELVHGDLAQNCDLHAAVRGTDVVYHLAAMSRALRSSQMMRVNAEGTYQLAQACAAQDNPPVLILISSLAAAGTARQGKLRVETDRAEPISNYGRAKRAGERAALALASRVPTTVLRPGIVFGERGRDMLPMFRAIARLEVHVVPRFSATPLSLIHVSDLVQIAMLAAERGLRLAQTDEHNGTTGQGYYFACDPHQPSYAQLGRLIAETMQLRCSVLLIYLPEPILWLSAGISELIARMRNQPSVYNFDKIREATGGAWLCSPEAVRRQLGFSPPYSLEERLDQTTRWYRDHKWF